MVAQCRQLEGADCDGDGDCLDDTSRQWSPIRCSGAGRSARRRLSRRWPLPSQSARRGCSWRKAGWWCERLIADGRYVIRSLLLSRSAHDALGPSLNRLDPSVPVYVCQVGRFLDITGFDIHRGCLALVERPAAPPVGDVLANADLVVVLEEVANADNVGGVFRNAAAFGAGARPAHSWLLRSASIAKPFERRWQRRCGFRLPRSRTGPWG